MVKIRSVSGTCSGREMGRWDQREKGDRDICLDEEEEGIGNEEERRTFAQDLLYGLCKNHQTGTADKSCIPSRLRMFTFAEANERERDKGELSWNERIWNTTGFSGKQKVVLEMFPRIFTRNFARLRAYVRCVRRARGDLVHEGGDPRLPAHVLPGHTLVSTPVQRG